MQIFKRINSNSSKGVKKQHAQNMVEFLFVFPTLIMISLVIFEVAIFWQDVNAVYNLNAEIDANVATVDYKNMTMGTTCAAATTALNILKKKDRMISMYHSTYTPKIVDGEEPFSLYKYVSNVTVTGLTDDDGSPKPRTTLWVDCRNPFENGITTQIEFYHKTIIMHASIPRFDKPEGIEIIPNNILIASPKLNTIRHY